MARFLSAEWITALDAAAARSVPTTSPEISALTIEQRVTGAPDGDVSYHLTIGPDGARVVAGAAPAPDVTVVTDYETARALHDGRTTAQAALAAGRYKLRGRPAALRALGDADDVFAAVRAITTFD